MVYGTDRGIMLPKDTPAEIVDHFAGVFETAMQDPKVVEALNAKGTSVVFLPPAEFRTYFEETYGEWERIAKEVGVYKREG